LDDVGLLAPLPLLKSVTDREGPIHYTSRGGQTFIGITNSFEFNDR
jgi:hypothetical protein